MQVNTGVSSGSLKDSYNKFKKNTETQSGQGYKKYKNWPWADLMTFLDDFQFRRKTDSNDTATTNETRSNEIHSSSTFTEDFNSTHSESEVCQVSSKTNTSYESKKKESKKY